jgi:hypothetical protein
MRLLNGNTTVRQRNSEGCTILPCGCAHTDVLWLQMCDPCATEYDIYRVEAQRAHESITNERALREELT